MTVYYQGIMYKFYFQDAALTVTESIVEKMKSFVKDDEGFKNVKSTATNILGSLGSMNSGSSKDSGSLPQNKTVTAVCTFLYPTQSGTSV